MVEEVSWPILIIETPNKELYWHDPSWGNSHNAGSGWFMALRWGEKFKHGGFYPSNRVAIESDEIKSVNILGWTRPLSEFIKELGNPLFLES